VAITVTSPEGRGGQSGGKQTALGSGLPSSTPVEASAEVGRLPVSPLLQAPVPAAFSTPLSGWCQFAVSHLGGGGGKGEPVGEAGVPSDL
jgi:hypothetical protein